MPRIASVHDRHNAHFIGMCFIYSQVSFPYTESPSKLLKLHTCWFSIHPLGWLPSISSLSWLLSNSENVATQQNPLMLIDTLIVELTVYSAYISPSIHQSRNLSPTMDREAQGWPLEANGDFYRSSWTQMNSQMKVLKVTKHFIEQTRLL